MRVRHREADHHEERQAKHEARAFANHGSIVHPPARAGNVVAALETFNPQQAAATRQILSSAGRIDVCGICGDDPAADYKIVAKNLPAKAVASIRLCADCRDMRGPMYGEVYEPLAVPGERSSQHAARILRQLK